MKKTFTLYVFIMLLAFTQQSVRAQNGFFGLSPFFVFNSTQQDLFSEYSGLFTFNTLITEDDLVGYSDVFSFNTITSHSITAGSDLFLFNTKSPMATIVAYSSLFTFSTRPGDEPLVAYSVPFVFNTGPKPAITGYSDLFTFDTTDPEIIGYSGIFTFNTMVADILTGYSGLFTFDTRPEEFEVIVEVVPVNAGTVAGEGMYTEGEAVVLEAIANQGYSFAYWADPDDHELSDDPVYTFAMPGNNVALFAHFQEEVGVYDPDVPIVSVYPNPARDKVFVDSDRTIVSIRLIDIHGRVVIERQEVNALGASLDVHPLDTGLYLVQIDVVDTTITRRVQIINQ